MHNGLALSFIDGHRLYGHRCDFGFAGHRLCFQSEQIIHGLCFFIPGFKPNGCRIGLANLPRGFILVALVGAVVCVHTISFVNCLGQTFQGDVLQLLAFHHGIKLTIGSPPIIRLAGCVPIGLVHHNGGCDFHIIGIVFCHRRHHKGCQHSQHQKNAKQFFHLPIPPNYQFSEFRRLRPVLLFIVARKTFFARAIPRKKSIKIPI